MPPAFCGTSDPNNSYFPNWKANQAMQSNNSDTTTALCCQVLERLRRIHTTFNTRILQRCTSPRTALPLVWWCGHIQLDLHEFLNWVPWHPSAMLQLTFDGYALTSSEKTPRCRSKPIYMCTEGDAVQVPPRQHSALWMKVYVQSFCVCR